MRRGVLFSAILIMFVSAGVRADIVFSDGNTGSLTDENVMFGTTPDIGTNTVLGTTQKTSTSVTFTSADLIHGNGGQARVEGCSGNAQNGSCTGTFDDLKISLTNPPGGNFGSLIFNINAVANGDVTITALDGTGNTYTATSQGMTIDPLSKNGQNFYTVVAINGQDIQWVKITSAVQLSDVRQIRLGAAGDTIPEPTSILLFGTVVGIVGFSMRRRFNRV